MAPAVSDSTNRPAPRGLPAYAQRGKYAGRWELAPESEQAPAGAPRKYYFYFLRGGPRGATEAIPYDPMLHAVNLPIDLTKSPSHPPPKRSKP